MKCPYCDGSMYHRVVEKSFITEPNPRLFDSYECCECPATVMIERTDPKWYKSAKFSNKDSLQAEWNTGE